METIRSSSFGVRPDKHTPEEILTLIPEEGVIIYDKSVKVNKMWNGSVWETISSNSVTVSQRAANYESLSDGTNVGQIAYVNLPTGTSWLPLDYGGTFYPRGWYLWNGSTWISDRNDLSEQLQLNVEGLSSKVEKSTGYSLTKNDLTDLLKTAYDNAVIWILANGNILLNHLVNTNNPHNVTKAQVGLSDVNNTSDLEKPISALTQALLNTKVHQSKVLTDVPYLALFTDTVYNDTPVRLLINERITETFAIRQASVLIANQINFITMRQEVWQ